MCKVLSAFDDRVLAFVVSWCVKSTQADLDQLAERLHESCSRPQRQRLCTVLEGLTLRLTS